MPDDIILHPKTRQLVDKLAAHLPHALIIDGPIGIGVLTAAKSLAHSVGATPYIVLPKKKLKGEMVVDQQEGSVIIEDIRQLYEQTRTTQPGKQVYIIDTGEKSMTPGAQNAFLKLLEEPHPGLHFIIVTHQFDKLLSTIVSRSQRLSLLPITDEQTNELLTQLHIPDATRRTRLAFVGSGRPALVKRLAADDTAYDARVAIMSDAKTMISGTAYEKIVAIHRYRDNRGDSLTLLDDMNHQLQTVLKSQPDQRLVREIATHLETHQRIVAGGNIRLQLLRDVL